MRRTALGALLLAGVIAPAIGSDLSDEAELYASLLDQGSPATEAGWISFERESENSTGWSETDIQAMETAFRRATEKDVVPYEPAMPTRSNKDYDDLVAKYASKHGLSPVLVHRVIQAESAYNPAAVSSKGAKGLMQLMDPLSVQFNINPFDPEQNIQVGTAYLASMIERFGSLELGLAAYNAGPGAVEKYDGIPPYRETQDYVKKITASL